MELSLFGQKFTGDSGTVRLMDDLGGYYSLAFAPDPQSRPGVRKTPLPGQMTPVPVNAPTRPLPTEAVGHEQGTIQFEKGDAANLPLDTATTLEAEGIVEIFHGRAVRQGDCLIAIAQRAAENVDALAAHTGEFVSPEVVPEWLVGNVRIPATDTS